MKTRIRAMRAPWNGTIDFLIMEGIQNPLGDRSVGTVTMNTVPGNQIVDPSFRLEYEEAQALMDELWTCGIRPSEGTGSAGALAATQKHLEDMRRLVFESTQGNGSAVSSSAQSK